MKAGIERVEVKIHLHEDGYKGEEYDNETLIGKILITIPPFTIGTESYADSRSRFSNTTTIMDELSERLSEEFFAELLLCLTETRGQQIKAKQKADLIEAIVAAVDSQTASEDKSEEGS